MTKVGLKTASDIVVRGIQAQNIKTAVAADNISKAGSPDATKHTVSTEALIVGGQGAGVKIAGIDRTVNANTLRQLREDISSLEELRAEDVFYQRVVNLMGSVGQKSALSNYISDLNAEMQRLAITPDDATLQRSVVNKAVKLADSVKYLADQVQELRREADEIIQDAVTTVNAQAENVATLNASIAKENASNNAAPTYQDERDKALRVIAELMGVNTYEDSSGIVHVLASTSGIEIAGTTTSSITHTAATAYTAANFMGSITLGGTDIKSSISGGKIKGLIDVIDTILPNVQQELDEFAKTLRDTMNATSNLGTAFNPAQTLTGTRTFSSGGATALTSPSGTMRVAVIDNTTATQGQLVEYVDVDLSSLSANTLTGLVTDINAGLTGTPASVNSSNQLSIAASSSSYGIAVVSTSSATINGIDAARYLGLNDIFTTGTNVYGDSRTGIANQLAVNSALVSDPTLIATGRLSTAAGPSPGDLMLNPGDNTNVQALVDDFSASASFSAAGTLGAKSTTFQSYAANIIAGVAEGAANTHSKALAQEFITEGSRKQFSNETGTNVTDELIMLQQNQMAFLALSRVQQVVGRMMEELATLGK